MIKIKVRDDDTYELLEDTILYGHLISKGFIWDGASAPVLATIIIPRAHGTLEFSCLHDYLCRNAKSAEERKEADRLATEYLSHKKGFRFRSKLGYVGVRIGAMLGVGVHYKHWTDVFKKKPEGV